MVTMRVCDVHKSLLSVCKTVKAGKRIIIDVGCDGGSFTERKSICEKLKLDLDGNLWTFKAFANKKPGEPHGFTRQRRLR